MHKPLVNPQQTFKQKQESPNDSFGLYGGGGLSKDPSSIALKKVAPQQNL